MGDQGSELEDGEIADELEGVENDEDFGKRGGDEGDYTRQTRRSRYRKSQTHRSTTYRSRGTYSRSSKRSREDEENARYKSRKESSSRSRETGSRSSYRPRLNSKTRNKVVVERRRSSDERPHCSRRSSDSSSRRVSLDSINTGSSSRSSHSGRERNNFARPTYDNRRIQRVQERESGRIQLFLRHSNRDLRECLPFRGPIQSRSNIAAIGRNPLGGVTDEDVVEDIRVYRGLTVCVKTPENPAKDAEGDITVPNGEDNFEDIVSGEEEEEEKKVNVNEDNIVGVDEVDFEEVKNVDDSSVEILDTKTDIIQIITLDATDSSDDDVAVVGSTTSVLAKSEKPVPVASTSGSQPPKAIESQPSSSSSVVDLKSALKSETPSNTGDLVTTSKHKAEKLPEVTAAEPVLSINNIQEPEQNDTEWKSETVTSTSEVAHKRRKTEPVNLDEDCPPDNITNEILEVDKTLSDEEIETLELRNELLEGLLKNQDRRTVDASVSSEQVAEQVEEWEEVEEKNPVIKEEEDHEEETVALREILISQMRVRQEKKIRQSGDDSFDTDDIPQMKSEQIPMAHCSHRSEPLYSPVQWNASSSYQETGPIASTSRGVSYSHVRSPSSSSNPNRKRKSCDELHSSAPPQPPPPVEYQSASSVQPQRVVKLSGQPLYITTTRPQPPPPPIISPIRSVRNLPKNDLRKKLLLNASLRKTFNENDNHYFHNPAQNPIDGPGDMLFPEFGVRDTDWREGAISRLDEIMSDDITIRRTVNFNASTTSGISSVTWAEPCHTEAADPPCSDHQASNAQGSSSRQVVQHSTLSVTVGSYHSPQEYSSPVVPTTSEPMYSPAGNSPISPVLQTAIHGPRMTVPGYFPDNYPNVPESGIAARLLAIASLSGSQTEDHRAHNVRPPVTPVPRRSPRNHADLFNEKKGRKPPSTSASILLSVTKPNLIKISCEGTTTTTTAGMSLSNSSSVSSSSIESVALPEKAPIECVTIHNTSSESETSAENSPSHHGTSAGTATDDKANQSVIITDDKAIVYGLPLDEVTEMESTEPEAPIVEVPEMESNDIKSEMELSEMGSNVNMELGAPVGNTADYGTQDRDASYLGDENASEIGTPDRDARNPVEDNGTACGTWTQNAPNIKEESFSDIGTPTRNATTDLVEDNASAPGTPDRDARNPVEDNASAPGTWIQSAPDIKEENFSEIGTPNRNVTTDLVEDNASAPGTPSNYAPVIKEDNTSDIGTPDKDSTNLLEDNVSAPGTPIRNVSAPETPVSTASSDFGSPVSITSSIVGLIKHIDAACESPIRKPSSPNNNASDVGGSPENKVSSKLGSSISNATSGSDLRLFGHIASALDTPVSRASSDVRSLASSGPSSPVSICTTSSRKTAGSIMSDRGSFSNTLHDLPRHIPVCLSAPEVRISSPPSDLVPFRSLPSSPNVMNVRSPISIPRLIIPVRENDSTTEEESNDEQEEEQEQHRSNTKTFQRSLDEFLRRAREQVDKNSQANATPGFPTKPSSVPQTKALQKMIGKGQLKAQKRQNDSPRKYAIINSANTSPRTRALALKHFQHLTSTSPTLASSPANPSKTLKTSTRADVNRQDKPSGKISNPQKIVSAITSSNQKAIIDDLAKKIMQSRDQLALSAKEKELLLMRQQLFGGYRDIQRSLQQNVRLVNLDKNLETSIVDLQKKLDEAKRRQKTIRTKASVINQNIKEKSRNLLTTKSTCSILSRELKQLGDKVIGDKKYKVTDIFSKEITETIKSLEVLSSKQPQPVQLERGAIFQQILGDFEIPSSSLVVQTGNTREISATLPETSSPSNSSSSSSTVSRPVTDEAALCRNCKCVVTNTNDKETEPPSETSSPPPQPESQELTQTGCLTKHSTTGNDDKLENSDEEVEMIGDENDSAALDRREVLRNAHPRPLNFRVMSPVQPLGFREDAGSDDSTM